MLNKFFSPAWFCLAFTVFFFSCASTPKVEETLPISAPVGEISLQVPEIPLVIPPIPLVIPPEIPREELFPLSVRFPVV